MIHKAVQDHVFGEKRRHLLFVKSGHMKRLPFQDFRYLYAGLIISGDIVYIGERGQLFLQLPAQRIFLLEFWHIGTAEVFVRTKIQQIGAAIAKLRKRHVICVDGIRIGGDAEQ